MAPSFGHFLVLQKTDSLDGNLLKGLRHADPGTKGTAVHMTRMSLITSNHDPFSRGQQCLRRAAQGVGAHIMK